MKSDNDLKFLYGQLSKARVLLQKQQKIYI